MLYALALCIYGSSHCDIASLLSTACPCLPPPYSVINQSILFSYILGLPIAKQLPPCNPQNQI